MSRFSEKLILIVVSDVTEHESRGKRRDSNTPEYGWSTSGIQWSTSGVQRSTAEYSRVQAEYVKYGGVLESRLFPLGTNGLFFVISSLRRSSLIFHCTQISHFLKYALSFYVLLRFIERLIIEEGFLT
jgi:hypothetical protein